jgi:hypothetical protein
MRNPGIFGYPAHQSKAKFLEYLETLPPVKNKNHGILGNFNAGRN